MTLLPGSALRRVRPHARDRERATDAWTALVLAAWLVLGAAVTGPVRSASVVAACLCATTSLAALACWARVLVRRTDRTPWALLATGWSAYAVGFVLVLYAPGLQAYGPGALNLSDTVSLALYPCGWTGLVLLARRDSPQRSTGLLLDAGVVGCAGGALALAWTALRMPGLLRGSLVDMVYALAYPVGGATLLVVLLTGLAVVRWRLDARWAWTAAGLTCMTVGDAVYGARSGAGTFAFGTSIDPLYTAGPVFMAVAAWRRPAPAGLPVRADVSAGLFAPAGAMVLGLGLLVLDHTAPLPGLAVVLAALAGLLGVARTVAFLHQEVRAEDALREALSDDLTGLWNRRALLRAVDETLADGPPCGLLLVDLKGVDQVNDTLGHAAGDALLVHLAGRLRGVAGDRLVARLAGDEFAVVTRGADDTDALARPLLEALAQPVVLAAVTVSVAPVTGGADHLVGDAALDAGELLRRGRVALDAARRTSRSHVRHRPDLDEGALERLALAHDLQQALELDQIVVHHQPKTSCRTGRVHGLEALVRWQHPDRGLLGPGAFVPAAESAGLLPALTRRVLSLALRQVCDLRRVQPGLQVAVNLGAPDLLDPGFVDHVRGALAALDLPPSALRVEVTETVVMSEPEPVLATLRRLRELGVGVSLDDYGTGLASLSYLRDLPLDELKIDRSFVQALVADPVSALIVSSTIDLAHGLGLTVVAEGIEDAPTLEALCDSGCDLVQGFLLGRPVPAADLRLGVSRHLAHRVRLPTGPA